MNCFFFDIVTIDVQFGYNRCMVVDDVRNLQSYHALDERIRHIAEYTSEEIPVFHGFHRDCEHTVIFTVERGSVTASTSWRENPGSRDVTAAVRAEAGMFVLYLPGEPFIVRSECDETEAVMRTLGDRDGS